MRIPVGEFGNILPRANPTPRIGEALGEYADQLYKGEAARDAAAAIIGGKRKLDEWQSAQESGPLDEQGNKRFETADKDFDRVFGDVRKEAMSGTRNTAAHQAIDKDLTTYAEQMRSKVLGTAQKQKQDYTMGVLTTELEALRENPDLDDTERNKRTGQIIGSMVVSGGMKMEDGVKLRAKEDALNEYGKAYTAIQKANTREGLYEVRGQISTFNPRLTPEQNKALVELANARIRAIEDAADLALKSRQDETTKTLDEKARAGTLTTQDVETSRQNLQPDDYRRFLAMPDINKGPVVDAGSESFVRDIERDILHNYNDQKRLEGLRPRIIDLMTGYDPKTRTYGERKLSAEAGQRMLGDVERYLREIRTETRAARSDTESKQQAAMNEARNLLKSLYDARGNQERVPSARADVEARYIKAQEDLLRHKNDPLGWLEQHKKTNQDIVTPTVRLPSWAVSTNGKLDAAATLRKLLDDKKAGRLSEKEYKQRFDKINEMKP